MVTGGWITQAGRSRWQQRAAAILTAILAANPGIPVIAWTVPASGGALSGHWQQALGLDEAAEIPSASGMLVYLNARGGVTICLTATVFDGGADSR